jgi:hypothetical protein
VESYLYALCPFANATQLKPRDAEYWRVRFNLPGIDEEPLPPSILSIEPGSSSGSSSRAEDSSKENDVNSEKNAVPVKEGSAPMNDFVSETAPLDATVAVDGSSIVNTTSANSSSSSSSHSNDSGSNDSGNATSTVVPLASSVGMEPELLPKKKRKKKKKSAVPPLPPLPEGPPVVLGHWSGWETPHPIPRPGDEDAAASLAPPGLTSGGALSAASSLSGGSSSKDQPLVFESAEAAEAHAVVQAAAQAALAARSGADEALASAPLLHLRWVWCVLAYALVLF